MDTARFDRIATTLAATTDAASTRRNALRRFAAVALGAAGLAAFGADADAKKRTSRKRKGKGKGKGKRTNGNRGKNGGKGGATPRDMCPVSAPAPNSPTCGSDPGLGACTCTRAVEGNNICVGFIDQSCDSLAPCASTSDCRKTVGFHFFCQAPGTGSCGQRCVPECGNTNPF